MLEYLIKKLQKTNQEELCTEKVIKEKTDNWYVARKGYDNFSNSWSEKMISLINFYTEQNNYSKNKVKQELDFFNSVTKTEMKKAAGSGISELANKID